MVPEDAEQECMGCRRWLYYYDSTARPSSPQACLAARMECWELKDRRACAVKQAACWRSRVSAEPHLRGRVQLSPGFSSSLFTLPCFRLAQLQLQTRTSYGRLEDTHSQAISAPYDAPSVCLWTMPPTPSIRQQSLRRYIPISLPVYPQYTLQKLITTHS